MTCKHTLCSVSRKDSTGKRSSWLHQPIPPIHGITHWKRYTPYGHLIPGFVFLVHTWCALMEPGATTKTCIHSGPKQTKPNTSVRTNTYNCIISIPGCVFVTHAWYVLADTCSTLQNHAFIKDRSKQTLTYIKAKACRTVHNCVNTNLKEKKCWWPKKNCRW